MILTNVSPKAVWGFHQKVGVSKSLVEYLMQKGWENIPPVPVYSIPGDLIEDNLRFILLDGNHRRNAAEHLELLLPVAIYDLEEEISLEDGLAPFRHMNNPELYSRLLMCYTHRKEISKLMRKSSKRPQ